MRERVLILGDGGSGKSTFAVKLGAALGLPVTHLDLLRCDTTFQGVSAEVHQQRHDALLAAEKWIIEGHPRGYAWLTGDPLDSPTSIARMEACDTVVFLDYSPLLMLWRSYLRSLSPAHDDAIPAQARYEFNRYHLRRAWDFRRHLRPHILRELDRLRTQGKRVIVARDDRQTTLALAELSRRASS